MNAIPLKLCNTCRKLLPREDFPKNRAHCKLCWNKRERDKWQLIRATDPEKYRRRIKSNRNWQTKNSDKCRHQYKVYKKNRWTQIKEYKHKYYTEHQALYHKIITRFDTEYIMHDNYITLRRSFTKYARSRGIRKLSEFASGDISMLVSECAAGQNSVDIAADDEL